MGQSKFQVGRWARKQFAGINPTGKVRIRHPVQNLIFEFNRFHKVFCRPRG
jgi:hypothetical protein